MRRLNPRETIDLIRRAAETWRGIEVDEDLIEDGLVHAVFGLKCTAGDEEPEPRPVTEWLIRVFNALAQEPTAQIPFRGKGWGGTPHVPGPLHLDPEREDVYVEPYLDEVTVYVALPLEDPQTLRLLAVLQELDLSKLEKGLQKFCASTKARGEARPKAARYAKPPPKALHVPPSEPFTPSRKKRKKKAKPAKKGAKKPPTRKAAKRTKPREYDLIELAKKARATRNPRRPPWFDARYMRDATVDPTKLFYHGTASVLPTAVSRQWVGPIGFYVTPCRDVAETYARHAEVRFTGKSGAGRVLARRAHELGLSRVLVVSREPSAALVKAACAEGYSGVWGPKMWGLYVCGLDPRLVLIEPGSNPITDTKTRMLAWNPLPALPVSKRGMVPQMILGSIGTKAVYAYRGWDIEVGPYGTGAWAAAMKKPGPDPDDALASSTTFDGAVCAAKITVDYVATRNELEKTGESGHFIRMWDEIFQYAQRMVEVGYRPTRANVARAMERAYAWWDSLPLTQRVQLIDDVLALFYCRWGTDPSKW